MDLVDNNLNTKSEGASTFSSAAAPTKSTADLPLIHSEDISKKDFVWNAAVTTLKEASKAHKEGEIYPHLNVYVEVDSSIVDHRLIVVNNPHTDSLRIYFKTPQEKESIPDLEDSEYTFDGIPVTKAGKKQLNENSSLYVSDGISTKSGERLESLRGECYIEIVGDNNLSNLQETIQSGLKLFGVITPKFSSQRPFSEVEAKKIAYQQGKININEDIGFVLSEVLDGYQTYTITDQVDRLKRTFGNFTFFHQLYNYSGDAEKALPNILKQKGPLCLLERLKIGLISKKDIVMNLNGYGDLVSGGAEGVFTRLITTEGIRTTTKDRKTSGTPDEQLFLNYKLEGNEIYLIPELSQINRVDNRIYFHDSAGSSQEVRQEHRTSVAELMMTMKQSGHLDDNEQVFPIGFPVKSIVCGSEKEKEKVIKTIRESTALNSEEKNRWTSKIFVGNSLTDLIDIANDQPVGTTTNLVKESVLPK